MTDQPNDLSLYVSEYETAYNAHRKTYELRNPPPQRLPYEQIEPKPQRVIVPRENIVSMIALALMVIASVIVSGSHTLEVFGGGFVGSAGFVMIEVGIVTYAYIRTKTDYDEARHASVKKMVSRGMKLAFAVGIASNILDELSKNGVYISPEIKTLILIVLGVSAPVLALISGDTFGMFSVQQAHKQRKADAEYDRKSAAWNEARQQHERDHAAALEAWRDGLNASWNAMKSRMGVNVRVSKEPSNGLPMEIPMETQRKILPSVSTLGHSKQPQASKLVRDFLIENSEALEWNPLEIAGRLGIGKSTVYNVMNDLRKEQERAAIAGDLPAAPAPVVNVNGNHREEVE